MERTVGSTELRQRLTDILHSVQEEQADYVILTFSRSQAALISLEEYRLFQRYKQERDAFKAWLQARSDSEVEGHPMSPEEEMLAMLDQLREELASQGPVGDRPLELADVISRLEEIAQQHSHSAPQQGAFRRILDRATDLGVTDLAVHHDHYLYGIGEE